MSNSLVKRKDLREQRLIIVQAVACALLFHLFLAFGFVYKMPPPIEQQGSQQTNYMVTLDNSKEGTVQLKNWLKCHDPTLFIKPSRKYGFSATPHRSLFDLPPQDRRSAAYPEGMTFSPHILHSSSPAQYSADLAYYSPTPPRSGFVALSAIADPQRYPALLDQQRKVLLSPEIKDLQLNGVSNSTELKIISMDNGLIPRVLLKKTCGRRDLDLLAANLVLEACVAGKIAPGKEQELFMIWTGPQTGGKK